MFVAAMLMVSLQVIICIDNCSFTLLYNYHTLEHCSGNPVDRSENRAEFRSLECHSIPHHCWCILLTFLCVLSVCVAGKLMEASMTLLMCSVLVSRPVWTQ